MEKIQDSWEEYPETLYTHKGIFSFMDYDFINNNALYVNSSCEVLKMFQNDEIENDYIALMPESFRLEKDDDLQRSFDSLGNMKPFEV
jgi:hypothetical protein